MLVAHYSDNHGNIPDLPKDAELVINSGDIFPNRTRDHQEEIEFQKEWLTENLDSFKRQLDGRKFLYCRGNHDFFHGSQDLFQSAGIDAIEITNQRYSYQGFEFYGFPYVNFMAGNWNFEATSQEMHQKINQLHEEILVAPIDVLVAHAPIYEILDNNFVIRDGSDIFTYGEKCGNVVMHNWLIYRLTPEQLPKYYVHGHIHESHGTASFNGIFVSNAATTIHLIELKEKQNA